MNINKNVKIVSIILASVLLLSSCNQDTYSGFFGKMNENVYTQLGLDLPSGIAKDAASAVNEASTPQENEIDLTDATPLSIIGTSEKQLVNEPLDVIQLDDPPPIESLEDETDIIAINREGLVFVPILPIQTFEEKEELKENLKQVSFGEARDAFVEELEKPADEDKALAAHNATIVMKRTISGINDLLPENPADSEGTKKFKREIKKLASSFAPGLPQNPKSADILNIQATFNFVNSLNNLFVALEDATGKDLGEIDFENLGDVSSINGERKAFVQDVAFAIKVAKTQGQSSDFFNSITFASILGSINSENERGLSRGVGLSDVNKYMSPYRASVKLILSNYFGIEKLSDNKYTMDYSVFTQNSKNNAVVYDSYNALFTVDSFTDIDELNLSEAEKDTLFGVSGALNYSLSYFLANFDQMMDEFILYTTGETTVSNDQKQLYINNLLELNTSALDKLYNVSSDEDFIDSDFGESPLVVQFKAKVGDQDISKVLANDILTKERLELFINNLISILKNTSNSSIITEIIESLEETIDKFDENNTTV